MATHPSGVSFDIVGINESNNGRSCEIHECCGCLVVPHLVVRIRAIQVAVQNDPDIVESPALACFHVTGGVDGCQVGFLRRHLLRYKDEYDGRLAQVVEVYGDHSERPGDRAKACRNRGCCRATFIEVEYTEPPQPQNKRARKV